MSANINQSVKSAQYIKSPLNYIGGKHKLLPQIMPLLPKDADTFADLFCGGCNVGINAVCNKIIFNDINTILTSMFVAFLNTPIDDLITRIEDQINAWQLTKENETGYLHFREFYNKTHHPVDLYTLSCFSFNYQFRFNSIHKYNNPFGRNRSCFSETMKKNLIRFVHKLQSSDAKFTAYDFTEFPFCTLNRSDFVYCDPPYLITTGTYNDGKRGFKDWNVKSEQDLYAILDDLDNQGIRFALSNVMEHKGQINNMLKKWADKYNVIHLKHTYSNSSYNTKRMTSDEVLIVNYEV